jgi:hypothetical protein
MQHSVSRRHTMNALSLYWRAAGGSLYSVTGCPPTISPSILSCLRSPEKFFSQDKKVPPFSISNCVHMIGWVGTAKCRLQFHSSTILQFKNSTVRQFHSSTVQQFPPPTHDHIITHPYRSIYSLNCCNSFCSGSCLFIFFFFSAGLPSFLMPATSNKRLIF